MSEQSDGQRLVDWLRVRCRELGFSDFGICPAVESTGFHRLVEWINAGYAGQMEYFSKRLPAYRHPAGVLEGCRSIVVMTFPYPALPPAGVRDSDFSKRGRFARYVWPGSDYHDLIHERQKVLISELAEVTPPQRWRGVVDTAPLMEREVAQLAGLGWRGKNTLLINKWKGSYFFLSCLLTTMDLPPSQPHAEFHCGTCRACLDACPTDAFPQPGVMDASRCISYLTIEHRGPIPLELRRGMGEWVFGCDVCQEVCPWNNPRKLNRQSQTTSVGDDFCSDLDLVELFSLTEDDFRDRFRRTPFWRSRRRGVLRNAAIVMGNLGDERFVPHLVRGLDDSEELIRGAAAWSLGQIGNPDAVAALRTRRFMELSSEVLQEIDLALAASEATSVEKH